MRIQRFLKQTIVTITPILLLSIMLTANFAAAAWTQPNTPNGAVDPKGMGENGSKLFNTLVEKIAGWVLGIIGAVSVAVIIYSAIMLIVGSDDPEKRKKAVNGIVGAMIGLVIVLLSFAIVYVIGSSFATSSFGNPAS